LLGLEDAINYAQKCGRPDAESPVCQSGIGQAQKNQCFSR